MRQSGHNPIIGSRHGFRSNHGVDHRLLSGLYYSAEHRIHFPALHPFDLRVGLDKRGLGAVPLIRIRIRGRECQENVTRSVALDCAYPAQSDRDAAGKAFQLIWGQGGICRNNHNYGTSVRYTYAVSGGGNLWVTNWSRRTVPIHYRRIQLLFDARLLQLHLTRDVDASDA